MTDKHKNHLEKIQQQSLKSWGITDLNVKLSNKEVVNQIEELRAKLFLKTADSETALMVSNCLTDLIGDIEVEDHSYYNEQETNASLKAWHESRVL